MNTLIIRFNTLADLATFVKAINPHQYRINTVELTLSAQLSSFELAIAIEQYGALTVQRHAMA